MQGQLPSNDIARVQYLETVFSDATAKLRQLVPASDKPFAEWLETLGMRWMLGKTPEFDPAWYSSAYPDVGKTGIDPVMHYLRTGASQGRDPSPLFSTRWYISHSPELATARGNPLLHYLAVGKAEGRSPVSADKDTRAALSLFSRVAGRSMLPSWDNEREQGFLSLIEARYGVDAGRFDSIPVSVVMPTHNRAAIIGNAIGSVVAQSHQNWQLLVVDDGSRDATAAEVSGFCDDPRISYHFQEQAGVSKARNTGLDMANGHYVFYLDSDNLWLDSHIRTLVVFMELLQLEAAYSGLECVDDNGNANGYRGTEFCWEACREQNYIDMNCFAHRRKQAVKLRFNESLKRLVDWDFILAVTRGQPVAYAPFKGVYYFAGSRGDRITNRGFDGGRYKYLVKAIQANHPVQANELAVIRKQDLQSLDLANTL